LRHGSATHRVAPPSPALGARPRSGPGPGRRRGRRGRRASGGRGGRPVEGAPSERAPMGCPETRLDGVPQEAGLVQDTDPLRVTEGLVHEGLETIWGGIDVPADPIEPPLPAVLGSIPHRLGHLPAVLAGERGRAGLAETWPPARGIPAERTGRRSARGRRAWSSPSSKGHPSCRDGRPLASTVAVLLLQRGLAEVLWTSSPPPDHDDSRRGAAPDPTSTRCCPRWKRFTVVSIVSSSPAWSAGPEPSRT